MISEASSLDWRTLDQRYANLTILTPESDGRWRASALPIRCFAQEEKLGSGELVNMDNLVSPPSVNAFRADQSKVQKGFQSDFPYFIKSRTTRSLPGSNACHRPQKKAISNKSIRSNDFSGCTSCKSSVTRHSSYGSIPKGCNAVNSSDMFIDSSKVNQAIKRRSRKKTRRKRKQNKKVSSNASVPKPEVLSDYAHESSTSETYSYNYHGDELVSYEALEEFSFPDGSFNKIEGDSAGFNCSGAPMSCKLNIDEFDIVENTISSMVQSCPGEHQGINLDVGIQVKDQGLSILDGRVEISCYDDMPLKSLSNTPDSLVLDSVSFCSNSDDSTDSNNAVKPFDADADADGSGICFSESSAINSKKECLSNKNLLDGMVDLFDSTMRIEHHIQNFGGSDVQFLVPGKREKQIKTLPRSSTFYKFGNSKIGKENIHYVWQKVQRNDTDDVALKGAPLLKGNCNVALTMSRPEDKKQQKKKVSKKLKRKGGLGSKQEYNCEKGSNSSKARLNAHAKGNIKHNGKLGNSIQVNNEKIVKCVPKLRTQNGGSRARFNNDKVELVNSESVNISQVFPDELEQLESTCSSVSGVINCHVENLSEFQTPVYVPHLLGKKVPQIETEISLEYKRRNHSSVSNLQKWIPIGVKVPGWTKFGSSSLNCFDEPLKYWSLRDTIEKKVASSAQDLCSSLTLEICKEGNASCLSHENNFIQKSRNPNATSEHNENHVTADRLTSKFKDHCNSAIKVDSSKILQAVNDACRTQLTSEAIQIAIGGPIAEFERFLHFSSPVICQSPSLLCCPCLRDQLVDVALCRHQIPGISLGCLWQWYEKHGSYGLEIKAEDYVNSRRLGVDHGKFRAYFVPYLSAIQLFKSSEPIMKNNNEDPDPGLLETCEIRVTSDNSSNGLPIFSSVLIPQPCTRDSCESVDITSSNGMELLFEYFESDQPQRRQPLYEKIQALVKGNGPKQGKLFGDPTNLDSLKLHDLHPMSWYSVAWYPIYRIPDGNFRAAFLTYHSFGHLVCRGPKFESPGMDACVVSPVVGLQSYNAQDECWFHLRQSVTSQTGGSASRILNERLRTLEKAASLISTAMVNKGNNISVNRHPDYEFFLSRKSY